MVVQALEWTEGRLRLLDQTLLPQELRFLECADYREVVEAVRALRVRGAPMIGLAGAYAVVLAAQELVGRDVRDFQGSLRRAAQQIASARPTAVNLRWAVERVLRASEGAGSEGEVVRRLLAEARRIQQEDEAATERMSVLGAALLPRDSVVVTHCNTGSLATAGCGTALGVIRTAWGQRKLAQVLVTETRPLLQGSRLTTWELMQDRIPVTLMVDSAVASQLAGGSVTAVLVGADRIAANGDVANKVGTHMLAVLAREYGVPFYVVAPTSTVDLKAPSGSAIPIEERQPEEVQGFGGVQMAPVGVPVFNPAFDVTPARLVTAIVTERDVAYPPYGESLSRLFREGVLEAVQGASGG